MAIADVATERAHLLRASLRDSDVPLFPDLAAMLAGAELDAVDLCLPHHLHAEAIVAAARAGKAILSEKPLCTTLAEAATIGEALAASGVTFMMAHNQLFQPSLIAARQLLAEGAIGRPFVIRSNETFRNQGIIDADLEAAAREGDGPWAWRADPRQMGGGEVIDTGWHASRRWRRRRDAYQLGQPGR